MERRADPDELLQRLEAEEARQRGGTLKIFFGAAPGVGKTFAMLEAAQQGRADGVDLLVGVVETHGRPETQALLEGLEVLPRKKHPYRGKDLEEFDLDAALERRPQLLLVDELAHTNAHGSRHTKRWQDVMEVLDAGIDVWTTLNVQHIESLNDVIAQITHVRVRETLPDAVLERANEMVFVDLPPDALLERLKEGKVYAPAQAEYAADNFFRKGNLLALRELALRRTAERVDTDVLAYRREHGIAATWPVADHLLVCVGPSPDSAALIRAARRMAAGLRARWTAATVENPARAPLGEEARARVAQHLRLAEQLGADVVTLIGPRPSEEILSFARSRNVTRIVLGKPTHPRWRDFLFGSMLEEIVRGSGDIDVHVIRGEHGDEGRPPAELAPPRPAWTHYGFALLMVTIASLVAASMLFRGFDIANIVMVYVLAIIIVAYRAGRGPSLLTSVLSVAVLDFCFVPPYFTFAVSDVNHVLTFAVMLLVGFVVSGLTERVRRQAEAARVREQRTHVLYALTRDLAGSNDVDEIARTAARHIGAGFHARVVVLLRDGTPRALAIASGQGFELDDRERSVATWALDHRAAAGLTTDTLPGASALYLPLTVSDRTLGVLGVQPERERHMLDEPAQRHLLEAYCRQTAMALERARLAEEAHTAMLRVEREELRNTLLSSVSHDLRTPLAAITGAASTLLADDGRMATVRRELLETIFEEADRLERLVRNLLDMTRLESGGLEMKKDWIPLEEVVGTALDRCDAALRGRHVSVLLPPELPLVPLDPGLMGQVFSNLLENAAKYTPPGSPIEIAASCDDAGVTVEISDRGPGLPAGTTERVFEKFFRAHTGTAPGTGLGLAICRGIVHAHGGTITAENREGGGAVFRFTLPLQGSPPSVPLEVVEAQGAQLEPPPASEQAGAA
jgi:two-component system, OmpR family, sensor histidine kinase KdpD